MLQRTATFTYASLLRILGACFLLYGLYVIVLALTALDGIGQSAAPVIVDNTMPMENFIFYGGLFTGNPLVPGLWRTMNPLGVYSPGPLLWVGLGILCVSLSTGRVLVAYLGLQIALWMVSASVWTPILVLQNSTQYGLGAVGPFFLVTLVLSLALVALYKPVTRSLRVLLVSQG